MIGAVLLSLMMTFTVESKSSVKVEGTWPYDMDASYACTYQKGSVRAGDTATLQVTGLESLQIESVKLYLRSNKSDGAGQITIFADDRQLYKKTGTYKDWFGAYNNTDYQPIGWSGMQQLSEGKLRIELVGTVNSLHVEKFEISYTQAQPVAYSLTLVNDRETTTLTESAPGSGILLPECADRDNWYFIGWTTAELSVPTDEQPVLLEAGERYFPKNDQTLWAVWIDQPIPTFEPQDKPVSGYYILEEFECRLTGMVENGTMALRSSTQPIYDVDVYQIVFDTEAGTCTMYNYASDTYVGFDLSKNKLTTAASDWQYRLLPDNTWLFIAKEEADKVWMLFQKNLESVAWLHDYYLGDNPQYMWSLFRMPDPTVAPYYWSHPWPAAVEQVETDNTHGTKVLRNGLLIIERNGRTYTLQGQILK